MSYVHRRMSSESYVINILLSMKRRIRVSLYTYLFENKNICYLYNSETGLFTTIRRDIYEMLYNRDFEGLSSSVRESLMKKKVIVEDAKLYEYYHAKRLAFFSNINDTHHLSLVIAPTTGCNFDCPYCFEGKKENTSMTYDVIEGIVEFINSHKNLKTIAITWYGGEPLLAFEKMEEIVSKIHQECPAKIMSHTIVTNAYLINDRIISFIKENPFKSIQITLDGKEEHHNSTRYLKGSHAPTFKKILSSIDKLVLELNKEVRISIRVNINKLNKDDYASVWQMIKEKYPKRNIIVYPGFIRETSKDGLRMCYQSLADKDVYSFYRKMHEKDIEKDLYPKLCSKGCMTCHNNSFIIDPVGRLYKCWEDFNHPEMAIGSVINKKLTNATLVSQYLYDSSVFNDPRCKECLLFPVCDGGCAWYRFQNLFKGAKYNVCSYLKDRHILEEVLLSQKKNS